MKKKKKNKAIDTLTLFHVFPFKMCTLFQCYNSQHVYILYNYRLSTTGQSYANVTEMNKKTPSTTTTNGSRSQRRTTRESNDQIRTVPFHFCNFFISLAWLNVCVCVRLLHMLLRHSQYPSCCSIEWLKLVLYIAKGTQKLKMYWNKNKPVAETRTHTHSPSFV